RHTRFSRDWSSDVCSSDLADEAAGTARKTFEEGALAESLPTVDFDRSALEAGTGILSLFVAAGLAASNGEARRHIQGGGVRLNRSEERRVGKEGTARRSQA